jgi:hypothetical protein
MPGFFLFDWFLRERRRRERERLLQAANGWPTAKAKLLKPTLVDKDELAEGTVAQTAQIEVPFYFTLDAGFFGGHLRSVPVSDSEGRRAMEKLSEGMPVIVRYNSANPDEAVTLAEDNAGALPFAVWPG